VTRPLAAALVLVLLVVAGLVFVRAQDDGCPDPWVMFEATCTIPNELVVMTKGDQDRADVEAAILSSGGEIVFVVDGTGIYTVRYPVDSPAELAPFKAALEAAGFTVAYSFMMELFGGTA
jgi:hypothetical protein